MTGDQAELDYYRAIEDAFASLRGVPHTLSSADFHLLRRWWREGVPLIAVLRGMTEAFASRRARNQPGPIVSLRYCRHAVAAATRQLRELHAGAETAQRAEAGLDPAEALDRLASRLDQLAAARVTDSPAVARVLAAGAERLRTTHELPSTTLDDHLYALETILLDELWEALPDEERRPIEEQATTAAAASGASGEARERTLRALRDRALRARLGLPRMELG